jgi:uncharacterized surface protein with fasciclin (FAS1) repeats
MSKLSKVLLLLLSVLVLTQCEQDNWGSYYDRPSWLGPPIYQTLVQEGNFSMFVACIDRTGYALDRSGSYTVFAPNDEAFAAYLADKGVASVDDLDDQLVTDIVSYALIINPYTIEGLCRFEDPTYGTEFGAFKRQTMYYPVLRKGQVRIDVDGVPTYVEGYYLDQNVLFTNSAGEFPSSFNTSELNNKYYPYFLTEYEDFTAEDYGILFGDEDRYTGRNAYNAQMVGEPISAENGWIYELDRVVEPVPSLDDYLGMDDYDEFYALFEERGKIRYVANAELTTKFTGDARFPDLETVYVKQYAGDVPFAPNVEIFTREEGKQDAQKNGFTILAPNNAAMTSFYNSFESTYGFTFMDVLESGYNDVLATFLSNHMMKNMLWPRTANVDENDEVLLGSNGIFYGKNDVVLGPYFESVYAEIFLNPNYLEMKRALTRFGSSIRDEMLNSENSTNQFTVFLLSNAMMGPDGDGMIYDPTQGNFTNDKIEAISGSYPISANARFTRLMQYHIFKRSADAVIPTDFAGANWKYIVNYNSDVVRYRQGTLQGLGNIEMGNVVTPTLQDRNYTNGEVFAIDRLIEATPRDSVSLGEHRTSMWVDRAKYESLQRIKTTAVVDDNGDDLTWYLPECSVMLTWLKNPQIYIYNKLFTANKKYTLLLPTNAAIQQAITDGFFGTVTYAQATDTSLWHNNLDGIDGTADDNDSLRIIRQVQYFVAQHAIQDYLFVEDAMPRYVSFYNSDMQQVNTGSTLDVNRRRNAVIVTKDNDGFLRFTSRRADQSVNTVQTDRSSTNTFNIMMGGMMVHKIASDQYLKYDKPVVAPAPL